MTEVHTPTAAGPPVGADDRFLDHLSSAADLVGVHRFREAEVEVLRALSITPSDLRALKLLALVRFKLGRLDESRSLCREIAATLPGDAGIRLKLGLIALKLDRLDESVVELETAARLAPDDMRSWSYLGFAYARRGERTRAAAAFRRAGQEALAVETETQPATGASVAASQSSGNAGGDSAEGDHGAGIGLASAHGPAVPLAVAGAGTGRSTSPGVLPSAGFEPAFDQSMSHAMPIEARAGAQAREPRQTAPADPDQFWAGDGARSGPGVMPVAPLVGFAVSRLGPSSEQTAWIGVAARLSVTDGAFVRADAAVACSGAVRWEEARRRVHGRPSAERLGRDDAPFFRVRGRAGELFVSAPAGAGRLVPLLLEDDVLYLREECVVAFEGTVSWEYGHIPRAPFGMLQFRGRGLVAICVRGEPGAVKVSPARPVQAAARHLLGWVGRVVAHGGQHDVGVGAPVPAGPATAPGPLPITCEGEGVVLFDVERSGGRDS